MDITLGETRYFKFTSRAFATGIPTALTSGVISAYEDGSLTQITAGITLTASFDGVVGLNHIAVVATGANGFEAGKDYNLVITTGTVSSVSVVGEVIGTFSIDNSAALKAVDLLNDVAATDIVSAGAITTLSGAVVNVDLVDLTTTTTNLTTNNDKTGYAISGTKTTLDALNDIAATAIVSAGAITTLSGAVVNVDLVDLTTLTTTTTTNTDMRGTDSALLAANVPANFSSMTIDGSGSVDAFMVGILATSLAETTTGNLADNFDTFYDNANALTTKTVDDVGGGSGSGLTALGSGTAQSGTTSTIVLAAASSFANDVLNGNNIKITGGTGAGQSRVIIDYVGASDTATVSPNWTTAPDVTSTYEIVDGSVNITVVSNAAEDISTATAVAAVKVDTAATSTATVTDIPATLTDMSGATFSTSTDSLEAIRNRGDSAWTTGGGGSSSPTLLQSTTIATLASQISFTLTAGSPDNDPYNNAFIVITDSVTSTQKAVGRVSDYIGSSLTITLEADPGIFTMAVGDTVDIIAQDPIMPVTVEAGATTIAVAAVKVDTAATLLDTGTDGVVITQASADKVWDTTSRTLTDGITKNATFNNFMFAMVLTSDHVTPATGLTVTGQRSIDAGAFASVTGTIAEISNGIYQIDFTTADTNGDIITYRFSSGTADDTFITITTQ